MNRIEIRSRRGLAHRESSSALRQSRRGARSWIGSPLLQPARRNSLEDFIEIGDVEQSIWQHEVNAQVGRFGVVTMDSSRAPVLQTGGGSRVGVVGKGADFATAMALQIASTDLVIEPGLILALLLGWQFTLAEFAAAR